MDPCSWCLLQRRSLQGAAWSLLRMFAQQYFVLTPPGTCISSPRALGFYVCAFSSCQTELPRVQGQASGWAPASRGGGLFERSGGGGPGLLEWGLHSLAWDTRPCVFWILLSDFLLLYALSSRPAGATWRSQKCQSLCGLLLWHLLSFLPGVLSVNLSFLYEDTLENLCSPSSHEVWESSCFPWTTFHVALCLVSISASLRNSDLIERRITGPSFLSHPTSPGGTP